MAALTKKQRDKSYQSQPRTERGTFGTDRLEPLAEKILGVRLTQRQYEEVAAIDNKADWIREAVEEKLAREGRMKQLDERNQ
ncbi:MAG: hypothetical protein ACRCU2_23830 [Planktothrix sp.]